MEAINEDSGKQLINGMYGELCITTLYRNAMPLIRYRVQDIGAIIDKPCSCCTNLPRVFLRGRKQDQIKLGKKEFSPFYLEEVLYKNPEVGNNYFFEVTKSNQLNIVMELSDPELNHEKVMKKIKNRVGYHIGTVNEVRIVDQIPRTTGKIKRVRFI